MFRKEKWNLGAFIRLLMAGSLQGEFDISAIDPQNMLSSNEKQLLIYNLRPFLLVILYHLFLEKIIQGNLKVDVQQFGHQFGVATGLAYNDVLGSPDEAIEKSEAFLNELEEYGTALSNRSDEEINQRGMFFYLCQHFVSKFLPNFNPTDPTEVEKHFMAFDVAKQLYRNAEQGFNVAYGKVKIVD